MIEIASLPTNVDFDDIKDCTIATEMWDKLILMHGGDQNVLRATTESLSGKYDDMRMKEEENIIQYSN